MIFQMPALFLFSSKEAPNLVDQLSYCQLLGTTQTATT